MNYSTAKRWLDVAGALACLPAAGLLAIPISAAIYVEDRGPVIYCSERLGREMRPFRMLKFRSMSVGSPDLRNPDGSSYNSSCDARVTRVGKFLRRTSMDEIPQIWNVLRGEMSFVGPRPSPLGNELRYDTITRARFSVRPGVTGYSQAAGRNSLALEDRSALDAYYVDNMSFTLDVRVVLMTLPTVLRARGINRRPPLGTAGSASAERTSGIQPKDDSPGAGTTVKPRRGGGFA